MSEPTLCIISTHNDDGSVTLQYHGPVGEAQLRLIRASLGPAVAEQILSAEELAQHAALPNGVIILTEAP